MWLLVSWIQRGIALTVITSTPAALVIQRSRFISQAFLLNDQDAVSNILTEVKKLYPQATHYAGAWRLESGQERAFDDGEPSGTAGLPILNVLKHKDIRFSMIIVVRYYGGIKLGHGGLVHAYQKSALLSLDHAQWGERYPSLHIELTVPYALFDTMMRILSPISRIVSQQFDDTVHLVIAIDQRRWPYIEQALITRSHDQNRIHYHIIKQTISVHRIGHDVP